MNTDLTADIRLAVRKLLREPGLTLTVMAALGLGLGINTAVFTLVYSVLVRDLPFQDAGRILYLTTDRTGASARGFGLSLPEFRDYRQQSKVFESLAATRDSDFNLSDPQQPPERYRGAYVTANALAVTSVRPVLGRAIAAEDEQPNAPRVAVLGHRVWQTRYGSDPDILGRAIRLNGEMATVVGVMPAGFRFPVRHDIWVAMQPTAEAESRTARNLGVFGLIGRNESIDSARAEAQVITSRLVKDWPKETEGVRMMVRTFNEQFNGGNIRAVFLMMLGAVGFVVLIVCANVTNLLLARSLARNREMALRMAIGASAARVIRQLLVESLALAVTGGLLGLGVAWAGVRAFSAAVADVGKPYWIEFNLEPVVFAWLALLCASSAVAFGMAPALRLSRINLNDSLKEGERGSGGSTRTRWFAGSMVTAQMALALVLLVGAGLMVTSFLRANNVTGGLDADRWVSGTLNLAESSYEKPAERVRFLEQALERVRTIPGVEQASISTRLPTFGASGWRFEIEGQPIQDDTKWPAVDGITVSDGYFETIGRPMLRGRGIEPLDGSPGRRVIFVNDTFARKFFPNQDALGQRIRLQLDDRPWLTIAGIAPDIRTDRGDQPAQQPAAYLPYRQSPGRYWLLFLRGRPETLSTIAPALRKEIQAIDRDLPVADAKTYLDQLRDANWAFRVFSTIFATFAGFALLLAAVGLYAVISYSVNQRIREIGIRMALGAGAGAIVAWTIRRGSVPLIAGLALGSAGGFAVGKLLASTRLLLGTASTDPATLGGVAAVLAGASLLALWIPARRASRVDPLAALRQE
ncbi:MAG: ABC transporter permease [Bryobacteraceae bacterium]